MSERVGQQLGHYRLIQHLGHGGFADVYLGEHLYLNTKAAIKVLHTHLAGSDLPQFLKEARTIAALAHPHIIRVLDFGVENDTPFLVMEYAPNGTLRQRYPRGTRLSLPTIVPFVKQTAQALYYAHEQRLVHRDVKPENLLLGARFEVLLSDFGIALISQTSRQQTTQQIVGTASYMAPEQIQGKPQATSDQYSLGIVVYEWLTGILPFHGTFTEVASQHLFVPPPPLRQTLPDISPVIEEVVRTALAKDPQQRFATVLAFANALEQAGKLSPGLDKTAPTLFVAPTAPSVATLQAPVDPSPIITPSYNQPPDNIVTPPTLSPQEVAYHPAAQPARENVTRRALFIGMGGLVIGGGLSGLALYLYLQNAASRQASLPTTGVKKPTPATNATTTTPNTAPSPVQTQGQTLFVFQGHSNQVTSVAWAPHQFPLIASGSEDKSVQIWNATNGVVSQLHTQPAQVYTLAWSRDGRYIASSGEEKIVEVWEASSGNAVSTFNGHTQPVYGITWSPDGSSIASASADNTVQVWDALSGAPKNPYMGHTDRVWAVAWSPAGQSIASASWDGTAQIWDALSGTQYRTFRNPGNGHLLAVDWSPDGQYIAAGGEGAVIAVWQVSSGNIISTYQGHTNNIEDVKWSPDGKTIASASKDNTVQIWNALSGGRLYTYTGHSSLVWSCAWSPDGTLIVSGGQDQTARVWRAR